MKTIQVAHYHGVIEELEGTLLGNKNILEYSDEILLSLIKSALNRKYIVQLKEIEKDYLFYITRYSNFGAR